MIHIFDIFYFKKDFATLYNVLLPFEIICYTFTKIEIDVKKLLSAKYFNWNDLIPSDVKEEEYKVIIYWWRTVCTQSRTCPRWFPGLWLVIKSNQSQESSWIGSAFSTSYRQLFQRGWPFCPQWKLLFVYQ